MDNITLPKGYRALDLTDEKGHFCGKVLGDFGVDVIKIEKPSGDSAREIGPFHKNTPDSEPSLSWYAMNTSKRGGSLLKIHTVALIQDDLVPFLEDRAISF